MHCTTAGYAHMPTFSVRTCTDQSSTTLDQTNHSLSPATTIGPLISQTCNVLCSGDRTWRYRVIGLNTLYQPNSGHTLLQVMDVGFVAYTMYSLPGPSLLADVAHNLPNSPPISLAKPSHTCNLSLSLPISHRRLPAPLSLASCSPRLPSPALSRPSQADRLLPSFFFEKGIFIDFKHNTSRWYIVLKFSRPLPNRHTA